MKFYCEIIQDSLDKIKRILKVCIDYYICKIDE